MNWYKDAGSEWKEIIETVARETGRAELMIEKDTIQSLFSNIPMEIIIETNYYQRAYPIETHEVGSFVGRFCDDMYINMPIPFEASTFEMNVQSLGRTFVDKIFAVCDYRIQNMQDRDSRHLYDICKLLKHINLDDGMSELADIVRDDRMLSKNNPSAQLEYIIPDMLKEIIVTRFYESDYRNITKKLLYEDLEYDYVIENGIAVVAESDVFIYRNKHC